MRPREAYPQLTQSIIQVLMSPSTLILEGKVVFAIIWTSLKARVFFITTYLLHLCESFHYFPFCKVYKWHGSKTSITKRLLGESLCRLPRNYLEIPRKFSPPTCNKIEFFRSGFFFCFLWKRTCI